MINGQKGNHRQTVGRKMTVGKIVDGTTGDGVVVGGE